MWTYRNNILPQDGKLTKISKFRILKLDNVTLENLSVIVKLSNNARIDVALSEVLCQENIFHRFPTQRKPFNDRLHM